MRVEVKGRSVRVYHTLRVTATALQSVYDQIRHITGMSARRRRWSNMFSAHDKPSSAPSGKRPQGLYMYGGVGVGGHPQDHFMWSTVS